MDPDTKTIKEHIEFLEDQLTQAEIENEELKQENVALKGQLALLKLERDYVA